MKEKLERLYGDLRLVAPYFREHAPALAAGTAGLFLISLLVLPGPFISKYLIDTVIPAKDVSRLLLGAALMLGLAVTHHALNLFVRVLFGRINADMVQKLRVRLMESVAGAALPEKERFENGYLVSRIRDDAQELKSIFVDKFIYVLRNLFSFLIGLAGIFYLSPQLSVFTLLVLPFFVWATVYFMQAYRGKVARYYEARAKTSGQLEESLRAYTLFKLLARESDNASRFAEVSKREIDSDLEKSNWTFYQMFAVDNIMELLPVIFIGVGGYLIIGDKLTIGALVAYMALVKDVYGPVHGMTRINLGMQEAVIALARIKEILTLRSDARPGSAELAGIDSVVFRDVGYKYPGAARPVLERCSFSVSKGQKLGIVGPSGAGKTTLVKLLMGMYSAQSGEVLVNGLADFSPQSFRDRLSFVEQEPVLLNDTIYNNIALGLSKEQRALGKERQEELVREAIKKSGGDFVYALPRQLETEVASLGASLSVGQKQRLAIARALVRNPALLILDEPTSALDAESEERIKKTVDSLSGSLMMVIISHRLTMVEDCDTVVRLA